MRIMELLFKHCEAISIAKLLNYNCSLGRFVAISIEECCRDQPELANEIKGISGNFFVKPSFSSDYYLQCFESDVLLKICKFAVNNQEENVKKVEALKLMLFVSGGAQPVDNPPTIDVSARSFGRRKNLEENPGSSDHNEPLSANSTTLLEEAKRYESQFTKSADTRSPDWDAQRQAVNLYIEAAKLGNAEAKTWLESAVQDNTMPKRGEMWITLGDIYSAENADQALISKAYKEGFEILCLKAKRGNPVAIESLSSHPTAGWSLAETNQFLDKLLVDQIAALSSNDSRTVHAAQEWILKVFDSRTVIQVDCRLGISSDPRRVPTLPATYNAKREKAVLAVVRSFKFKELTQGVDRCWGFFRYDSQEYDSARAIVEKKLNELLGTAKNPIEFKYVATSLNHDTYVICPKDEKDNDRFRIAVMNTDFKALFATSIKLRPGMACESSLVLTGESWNRFTALLTQS